jgi:ubiquitin C-terminal hydrolase
MSDNIIPYETYDEDYVPDPFGLQNTGAICWFNSLIQVLLGLPALTKVLLECEPDMHGNAFAAEYIKLLNATIYTDTPAGSTRAHQLAYCPATILQMMLRRLRVKKPGALLGSGQECVDEGLVMFLEMLDCPRVEGLFSSIYNMTITCETCNEVVSNERDRDLRIQMFTTLPLNTYDAFRNFIRVHPSEIDSFRCDRCGNTMASTAARKVYRLETLKMLREIIVVVFDEFKYKTVRWFPPTLRFKCVQGGHLDYKLVGKVVHVGSQHGGHYWAHSLRAEWYKLNDMSVSLGNGTPELGTFMVVYHMTASAT